VLCDISRGNKQIRTLLTEQVKTEIELLANLLPQADSAARSKAILTVAALLGAAELARAVLDENLSRETLESTREVLKRPVSQNTHAKIVILASNHRTTNDAFGAAVDNSGAFLMQPL
jgi:hypothetical protein